MTTTPLNPETEQTRPTTPEGDELTPEQSEALDAVQEIVGSLTPRDWLRARKGLDMSTDEIMDDIVAMAVVAACKRGYDDTALWQWDKYLDLPGGLTALLEAAGISVPDESAEQVASKSD